MYYTYVLLCTRTKAFAEFYIGYTHDLRSRVAEHRSKSVRSTKQFDAVKLVYYEACLSKKDARKRELQLKTGFGRGYLNRRLEGSLRA